MPHDVPVATDIKAQRIIPMARKSEGESQARPKYMSVAIVPACIKLAITMPIKMKM